MFFLKEGDGVYGDFVYSNGTLKSSLIDVEFTVDVNQWITRRPISPKMFQVHKTAPSCPETTLPVDPPQSWAGLCYRTSTGSSSSASVVLPSIAILFALALLICIAL